MIEQVNHYYPFGGVYGDLSYKGELQRNKYIGKEFDHMYGLDWYDHGDVYKRQIKDIEIVFGLIINPIRL